MDESMALRTPRRLLRVVTLGPVGVSERGGGNQC